jgi:Lon protease-like protein
MVELPLFPLKTVLLPGNVLSLKIFESRYTDMVANCMRETSNFGIILIFKGEEAERNSEIHSIGTTANIHDWQDRKDGLLGITALGVDRFEIDKTRTQADGLTIATVNILDEESKKEVPRQYLYMQELLVHISQQEAKTFNPDDGFAEILYQLIYLLPLGSNLKQRLLEIPKSLDRAVILHAELIRLGIIQHHKPDFGV